MIKSSAYNREYLVLHRLAKQKDQIMYFQMRKNQRQNKLAVGRSVFYSSPLLFSFPSLGSLSNNDGDGYENVAWKVNLAAFFTRLFHLVNSSNVGKVFWS